MATPRQVPDGKVRRECVLASGVASGEDLVYCGGALLASNGIAGAKDFSLDHLGTARLAMNGSGQKEECFLTERIVAGSGSGVVAWLQGFCNWCAYALLLGLATWLFAWLPAPVASNQGFVFVLSAVNAPVAFISYVFPFSWQAVDLVFGRNLPHTLNSASFLAQHLRTAVPTYIVLFYLPNLLRAARRRWSASRATKARGA